MGEEDDSLDKLAESVADGDSIDWAALEKLPADDPRRRFASQLRILSKIVRLHQTQVDEPAIDLASTAPASTVDARVGGVRSLAPDVAATPGAREHQRWGHLLLLRKIGEGAFGEVFHAHDTWLDHPVALKLLKPEIAKSDFSSRILHEARRLARVRHPNVVSVHGADMHDGRIGFWMDLIEGSTLSDLVVAGRMSHGEASHIGQEICRALTAVHRASVVQRDVKAQNVMRAADGGRIILMDFGAGEFMDTPLAGSRVRGTPLYLAPELFESGRANAATDI